MRTVADAIVETIKDAGVHRIYGLPGDFLNGFTDALRRDGTIAWQHVRHEEAAAFAAASDAALTGDLAVCAGSCGPGNTHLVNGWTVSTGRAGPPTTLLRPGFDGGSDDRKDHCAWDRGSTRSSFVSGRRG